MPKKDTTRWIDLPYMRERDAVELIRQYTQEADSSPISAIYTRQVLWFVPSTAAVGTDVSAAPRWRGEDGTPRRIDAAAGTAPVGSALQYTVKSGGTTVGTVSIAAGATTGTSGNMDLDVIRDNNTLTLNCDAVGSATAGADVTVVLECDVGLEA